MQSRKLKSIIYSKILKFKTLKIKTNDDIIFLNKLFYNL